MKQNITLYLMIMIAVIVVLKYGPTHVEVMPLMPLDKTGSVLGNRNKQWPDTNKDIMTKRFQCKLVEPKLSTTPLPVTGLVSFPGAGNTWTRHLIQQTSGE